MKLEELQFLRDLQQELKTQDRDCQAAPRFWVVGDYSDEMTFDGEQDYYMVFSSSVEYGKKLDEYLADALMEEDELSDLAISEHGAITDKNDAIDWIQEYVDSDAYLVPLKEKHITRDNTMFLTKAECQKHIEANRHHYNRPHTYAMTAWRSPVVEKLLQILETAEF